MLKLFTLHPLKELYISRVTSRASRPLYSRYRVHRARGLYAPYPQRRRRHLRPACRHGASYRIITTLLIFLSLLHDSLLYSSSPTSSFSSAKALWRVLIARSVSFSSITHEIFISEVDIISILIFSELRTSKTFSSDPGVALHSRAYDAYLRYHLRARHLFGL